MRLLFVNALKGLRKKKVQMIGIIIMVALSTGIYTTMNMALDRMEDRYYNYLDTQKVEDFSFIPMIDYEKDYTVADVEELRQTAFKDIDSTSNQVLTMYEMCLKTQTDTCKDPAFLKSVQGIFTMYNANVSKSDEIIKRVASKYDFTYQQELTKTVTDNKNVYKAIPYNKDKKLNIAYLDKGRYPESVDEVALLPAYMEKNNLEIGDRIEIASREYKIVGIAYAPDHIFPLLSISNPMYDQAKHTTVYLTDEAFKEFYGYSEDVYVGRFNDKEVPLKTLFAEDTKLQFNMTSAMRIGRIDSLKMEIDMDRTFAEYFLYVLLAVAVLIIGIITKKRIEDERLQIGVLKALGYKSITIAVSYLVYPILGAILGGIIGFLFGAAFHPMLTEFYSSYFVFPLAGYQLDFTYLLTGIVVPLVGLTFLSYLISIFMLRHKALYLLKEGSNLKVNLLSKITTKLTKKLSFNQRFRASLATRSLGKLLIVSLTSFCTGLLITLVLIGMNLFSSMIDSSFDGLDFKYMVNYMTPIDDSKPDDTLMYEITLPVKKIIDSDGKNKKVDKDYKITLNGADDNSQNFNIKNVEGKKILNQLNEDHGLIINANVREIGNIDNGDTIVFDNNGKELTYHVTDVFESFFGTYSYVNRKDITSDLGLGLVYNKMMTSSNRYDNVKDLSVEEAKNIASILGVQDLKDNMGQQMEASNASIYIVIAFASVMALVIIAVIASIVIEENKKTISLMKVMGYDNRRISSIVLNIYTPFIIVSYLLSVPVMVYLLKFIVGLLTNDIDFAIPIGITPSKVIIGLVGLLLGYFIAIRMSRKTLDKVPLAVALKRE